MAEAYTFSDVVTLIREVETGYDEIGRVQTTEQTSESYAEIRSVGSQETYNAQAIGLAPELKIILPSFADDYHDEKLVEYLGRRYHILRVYKASDGTCELTVGQMKGPVSDSDTAWRER
jgi:SPP1 family predicted phage head-tail adaptor